MEKLIHPGLDTHGAEVARSNDVLRVSYVAKYLDIIPIFTSEIRSRHRHKRVVCVEVCVRKIDLVLGSPR